MTNFEELGLKPEIIKAIKELGFEAPMPIQEKTVPMLLTSHSDLVALAQTGTGKTAAFGLPILNVADANNKRTQAMVLCPTRELCMQITSDLTNFSKYLKGMSILAVYGGASIEQQIRELKKGVQVIVATPGRMNDLIRRGKTDISQIDTVVLDEADEMLNMGFQEELNAILAQTPATKRTLLFSATMPREVAAIASKYMTKPVEITVGKRNAGAETVEHQYYMVHAHDRYQALKRIADANPDIYGIIFCRTRQETNEVAEKLIKDGYSADALHGDLSQAQRDQVMQKFRVKNLQMLVATDVAARGLDVDELSHVINYNLPDDIEAYTHRSGRTGRAGKNGISIAIIHSRERSKIDQLERIIQKKFNRKNVPTGKEICERQLMYLIEKMQNVAVNDEQIEPYMPAVMAKLEGMSHEELIKRFVATEFNTFLNYYKNTPDLDIHDSRERRPFAEGRPERDRSPRFERNVARGDGSRKPFTRFFINLGSKDGIKPGHLLGLINECTRDRTIEIGRTSIMEKFSFFDADSAAVDKIMKSFKGAEYEGRRLVVDLAEERSGSDRGERADRGEQRERRPRTGGSFEKRRN